MLPDGWTIGHMRQIISSLDGGVSVNGEDRQALAYEKGVLRVSAVSYGTFLPTEHKAIVKDEVALAKVSPKADRIIFSRSNTESLVGASAYIEQDHPNLFLSDKLWQLEPNPGLDVSMRWLAYWLASDPVRKYLSKLGTGTSGSMKNIAKDELLSLRIALPPYKEQCAIAGALTTWDEAIAVTEKLLSNSRRQKQALSWSFFNCEKRLKDGPVAVWRQRHLHEVATRIQRQSDGAAHPVLMISSGSGFVRQDQKYSRFMAGKSVNDYILLKRGEFAYNKGNSKLYEFGCVFPLETYAQGLVPHVYVCFSLSQECDPGFFKHLFEANYLHDQLGALVNTGVRNNGLLNIRPADFMNVRVPVPPLDEQRAIARVLDVASKEIVTRERELATLKEQKRGLMLQLLTGKRRVRASEDAHEAAA